MSPPRYLPSPSQGVWHPGPVPIRGYALCLIAGFLIAILITDRRWQARGGQPGQIGDMAVWIVPAALIGARIYHLITSPDAYFGAHGNPVQAFEVWKGGLGIWGGLVAGPLAGWLWCRRHGVDPLQVLDCAAPAVPVGQAIGRLGNYFNQELYGGPTHLPWGLLIDAANRPAATPDVRLYQPTFLYELLWNLLLVVPVVLYAERRWQLDRGRLFVLYIAAYTAGRAWIEHMRIDPAHHLLGIRVNDYVSLITFTLAATYLYRTRRRPDRHDASPRPVSDGSGGADPDVSVSSSASHEE
ncbi:MAG TPA: prolipoprotein diacylglyceryl transferase [Mycobacteriales bacterium]|nr:prolipoprotein diacylglyceryl transferase [Mycobacteriales bacterium]